jgi:hypothetical protein
MESGAQVTKRSWTNILPDAPPVNRMKLAFYRITRNEGMEADDVDFARFTPTRVFIGDHSYSREEIAVMGFEWWKDMATSPPLFN